MPRFTLTDRETEQLGQALAAIAQERGLGFAEALVAAANTTAAELRALSLNHLNAERAALVARLNAADAQNAAMKANLTTSIAAIDSALGKL